MSEGTGRRFFAPARPSNARPMIVFLVAGLLAAFGNTAFQRACAANGSIDDVGAFNALLAVIGGVGLLGLGLQLLVARLQEGTRLPLQLSVGVGVVVAVLVTVGLPVSGWYAVSVAGLMGATTTATFCGVSARARLLRGADWVRIGAVTVTGAAVRLAALPLMLAIIDTRLVAAIAATFVGEVAMSAGAALIAPRRAPTSIFEEASLGDVLRVVLVLGGLWMLTVVDTVLARLTLSQQGADVYSLATTVSRSSFFLATLLTQLALPTFVHERGRSRRTRDVFTTTASALAVVAALTATVIIAAPTWVATNLLGDDARIIDRSTLRVLAAAWAAMSVVPLLTFFHLSRHPRLATLPGAAALLLAAEGLVFRNEDSLARATLVVFALCALALALPAWQRLRPVTAAVAWTPATSSAATGTLGASGTDVAVVIPFFNPGREVLGSTVGRLVASLDELGGHYRVIAVSDGSTDGSAAHLRSLAIAHVEVIELPHNRGKGAALRAGLARTNETLIGYIDADGDLPPEQIRQFVDIATSSGADAVIGSKVHPASTLSVARHRTVMSMCFRLLVRGLFRLDVRDTQTGLKLYRGEVVGPLVARLREDGFAIDVEILVAARRDRPLTIVEAPVVIVSSTSTTVSWRRALGTGGGLCRIFWRNHVALLYDVTPEPAEVGQIEVP